MVAAERATRQRCGGEGRLILFAPRDEIVTMGRAPEGGLVLGWDGEASRAHARLQRVGGHWTVIDDGLSRDSTFVGGERVTGRWRSTDTASADELVLPVPGVKTRLRALSSKLEDVRRLDITVAHDQLHDHEGAEGQRPAQLIGTDGAGQLRRAVTERHRDGSSGRT